MPLILGTNSIKDTGYDVANSCRFNDDDDARISKTFSSAGNSDTWTMSAWVKRCTLGANSSIFTCNGLGALAQKGTIRFDSSDKISAYVLFAGGAWHYITSNAVYRDTSAWMHIVVRCDTTQSTDTDRLRLYVNGTLQTLSGSTYPDQNEDTFFNEAEEHQVASLIDETEDFDGYMAEFCWIDGSSLAPTSFGEFDEDSGIWKPIDVSGLTFGTNGVYLDFEDSSDLGKDASGNSNWTATNLSATDQSTDTCTNNFATLNPLTPTINTTHVYTDGNLTAVPTYVSAGGVTIFHTINPLQGKWYYEIKAETSAGSGNAVHTGVVTGTSATNYTSSSTQSGAEFDISSNNIEQRSEGSSSVISGSSFSSGDIGMIAVDMDNGKIYIGKNGSATGSAVTISTDHEFFFGYGADGGGGGRTYTSEWNFGQRPFSYNAPSGFKALCTKNLSTPPIAEGADYFNTVLYTGTGAAKTISSLNFGPDMVWIKERNGTSWHRIIDIVRGQKELFPNAANVESSFTQGLNSFNSDGFTLGTGADSNVNTNNLTYVAWCWDGGSSTTSNYNGSITSSVRANTSAGFSIVSYTGTGSAGTIGHGLNAKPSVVLIKSRDTADSWYFYTDAIDGSLDYNQLEGSGSFGNSSLTLPTSNVFYVSSAAGANKANDKFIAYCFAPVAGYSAISSYTGNGSSDGTFVYTGFRPAFLLTKRTDGTAFWAIVDSARDPENVMSQQLYPNNTNAESAGDVVDFLSNGFKIRSTSNEFNTAATYLYYAVAEHPFKTARAR